MSVKNHSEKEQFQEILLELKRSKEREAQLHKENQVILRGLSAISDAQTKEDIFNGLLNVIKEFVEFDNAIVVSSTDKDNFSVLASTNPYFDNLEWSYNDLFYRACHDETIVLFQPHKTKAFLFKNSDLQSLFSSVAICGLKSHSGYAVIILACSRFGAYSTLEKDKIERFMPLVERAVIDIDYKERLNAMVSLKTKELFLSKERFQDFAETVGDWFWETDPQFNFTYLSDTKINNTSIISQNLLSLISNDFINSTIIESEKNLEPFHEVEWNPDIFNNKVWLSLSGKPFFDEFGTFVGYRGTAKDISARKKRIRDIQTAKTEAEKANKAKSQFLAMMSHEIRTPLNSILGLVDVFHSSLLSEEQLDWLNQMESSSQLLLTIISDVLDISRIEAGTFVLNEQPIDLLRSLNTSINFLNTRAKDKGITLTVTASQNIPKYVFADATRLSQIIFNLVGNAIKFTNHGHVAVKIDKLPNNSISISVTDSGIGIASTTLEQLFKPFVQADSSITRKYGGTGLGLAIIKRLVELMQGTIAVESRLNVGSTFKITLPLKEISNLPKQLNNEAKELVNQRSLNILLAEDNKANQAVLQILLEKQGHHVSIVSNGEEAISIFKYQTNCHFFDVVLMDVSMPVKDGISATTELRKLGIELPIIAITAHAMETEKEMCLEAGMNDFISKPIRAKDLSDILIKYSS
nr:ATP-binding protein [Aliivibrio fischeri]